jgi:integrase/recombinase XerC
VKTKKEEVYTCEACGEAVPAFAKWRGRIVLCDKPECFEKARKVGTGKRQLVEANKLKCVWPDCSNFVPAGLYQPHARGLTCSEKCYWQSKRKYETLTCMQCGREYRGKSIKGHLNFCNKECTDNYSRGQTAIRCGIFRQVYEEYIAVASLKVRCIYAVRAGLSLFLQYLTEIGITNLDEVEPPTITSFLEWGQKTGRRSVWNAVFPVSAFFRWLYGTGRRKKGNPVDTRFHARKKAKRLPRPYSEEEVAYIWELLDKRGSTMIKAAVAILEESGLRISEIANLRVSDIDVKHQRLFVRTPNKTMTEAYVPFHAKSVKWVGAWLKQRDANLGHDYLFHNTNGGPATKAALHHAIAHTLCKTHAGRQINEYGLTNWSNHRLRHTMASRMVEGGADAAAVMAVGRWACHSTMLGYAAVSEQKKSSSYHEAMARVRENKKKGPKTSSSFRKYLKSSGQEANTN